MPNLIKAYAIFAGGGVKGTAFAGCMKAAEQFGFEFVGYAGASAGSIAAALACAGYNHEEMKDILAETDYRGFFEDDGQNLRSLLKSVRSFDMDRLSLFSLPYTFFQNRKPLGTIKKSFGLYQGENLNQFLRSKINKKIGADENSDILFSDLGKDGRPPLKVIVSDVVENKPIVFSNEEGQNVSVIDAVRASSSFPFIFKPTEIGDKKILVDGGLSCNLPFFVFEKERRMNNLPVIAFNLVPETTAGMPYTLMDFCSDMINTALESSEILLHQFLQGIYIVQIKTKIRTFQIDLTKDERESLFAAGYEDSMTFFSEYLKEWQQADTRRERLQALYAPPYIVEPVLASLAKEFETRTASQDVRVSISLPNRRGKRIVAYHYGFRSDDFEIAPDFELDVTAGSSGAAWEQHAPTFADFEYVRANPKEFGMTEVQARAIRADRKAIFSIPIFHLKREAGRMAELEPFGVLSVDTCSSLDEVKWREEESCRVAVDLMKKWSDVISYILKGSL